MRESIVSIAAIVSCDELRRVRVVHFSINYFSHFFLLPRLCRNLFVSPSIPYRRLHLQPYLHIPFFLRVTSLDIHRAAIWSQALCLDVHFFFWSGAKQKPLTGALLTEFRLVSFSPVLFFSFFLFPRLLPELFHVEHPPEIISNTLY